MSGNFARNKGQRGEREFQKLLLEVIREWELECRQQGLSPGQSLCIKRNLMQSMEGGYDLIGIDWLAIEIKNCEKIDTKKWWEQISKAAKPGQIAVVAYKISRVGWKIMMKVNLPCGQNNVKIPAVISYEAFRFWFKEMLKVKSVDKTE